MGWANIIPEITLLERNQKLRAGDKWIVIRSLDSTLVQEHSSAHPRAIRPSMPRAKEYRVKSERRLRTSASAPENVHAGKT